jgi:hypothetical protein
MRVMLVLVYLRKQTFLHPAPATILCPTLPADV